MAVGFNGKPEKHFLMILHICSTDPSTITKALPSFLQQKQLDLRKLTGQGYDGAATFAGKISGVHNEFRPPVFWNHVQRLVVVLLFSPKK